MTRVLVVLAHLIGLLACPAAEEAPPLTLVQTIPLPGVGGRIDHFGLDGPAHRLYVAALGNNTVEVIDLQAGTVVHRITGLKEPQGVVVIPEPHQVVVANGDDGTVAFFDAATYDLLHTIDLKSDADNVRYDPVKRLVYVGYGSGGISTIDPATRLVVATTAVPRHPEAFALESAGPHLFVNVPEAHEIDVLDRSTRAVTATWDLAKGFPAFFAASGGRSSQNFPMALDEAHRRLFVGCRRPARMLVFDTQTGVPVAQVEIGGDTDDIFYDEVARRVMVSCGDGLIDVIAQVDPDHYAVKAAVQTASGARTSWWVPETRRLYVAIPQHRSRPAAVLVYQSSP